jgi:hypothetical protein
MDRDGIKKLPRWSKGRRVGCATIQDKRQMPHCEHAECGKRAGYSTPKGYACFAHAIAQATFAPRTPATPKETDHG